MTEQRKIKEQKEEYKRQKKSETSKTPVRPDPRLKSYLKETLQENK